MAAGVRHTPPTATTCVVLGHHAQRRRLPVESAALVCKREGAADARRKLTDAHSKYRRTTVYDSLDTQGKVAMLAASKPGARVWLDAAPSALWCRMSGTEYRIGTCLWLDAVIAELRDTADPRGRKILQSRGIGRSMRHIALNAAIGDMEIEAGARVWWEPPHLFAGCAQGKERRPDLAIQTPQLEKVLLDGTVRDTVAPSLLARANALERPLRAVVEGEEDKNKTYLADTPAGFSFQPFAVGTQTELGPSTTAYVGRLAVRQATRHNNGLPPCGRLVDTKLRLIRSRVGWAVVHGMAGQVVAAIAKTPHVALLTEQRYVHSLQYLAPATAPCVCAAAADRSGADCVCFSHTPLLRGAHASRRGGSGERAG